MGQDERRSGPWLVIAGMGVVVLMLGVAGAFGTRDIVNAPGISIPNPDAVYDPTEAGEDLPDGYRRSLPRDAIAPVYDPEFTDAASVTWPDDSLVVGVAGSETAKAYPVTYLNRREMVLDDIDGLPILVSW